MYKRFILLFLFPCCSSFLFAQIENQKGEIINKSGNVINCSINYFNDQPTDIDTYDSFGVKKIIPTSEVKEIKLDNGKKFVVKKYFNKQDSVILIFQVIIESPMVNLLMRDENDNERFYVLKDNLLYRLENNEEYITPENKVEYVHSVNDITYKKYNYQYIGILKIFMSDNPDILKKLDKIKLSSGDLIKIISEYNKGNITYFWDPTIKLKSETNWVLFGQYSNYCHVFDETTASPSYGIVAGFQLYFSRNGRNSFKFAMDYANYNYVYENPYYTYNPVKSNTYIKNSKVYGISCRYEYDVLKAKNYSIYFMFHIADLSYYFDTDNYYGTKNNGITFRPRLSPGAGFEIKPWKLVAIYAELNHLLQGRIPGNFSVGLKYDFGKRYG